MSTTPSRRNPQRSNHILELNRSVSSLPSFPSSVDRPTGQYTAIPSAVTGKTLRYFTPDTLGDLFGRIADVSSNDHSESGPSPEHLAALSLVPAISRSRSDPAAFDAAMASALCDVIVVPRAHWSAGALMGLARPLSPKATALREEIVFSGGPDAGSALHVYAPHGELPRLFGELERGISLTNITSPSHRAAVVAYYCLDMHPFRDANGRWSRLVTVATARTARERHSAVICAAFHVAARTELVRSVFPATRSGGLRRYLTLVLAFESAFIGELERTGMAGQITAITSAVRRGSGSERVAGTVLSSLWTLGELSQEQLRSQLNVSAKVVRGLASAIAQIQGQQPGAHPSVRSVIGRIAQSVEVAKRSTFGD